MVLKGPFRFLDQGTYVTDTNSVKFAQGRSKLLYVAPPPYVEGRGGRNNVYIAPIQGHSLLASL